MIRITKISNADRSYDENWAIVRYMKSKSDFIQQKQALSPSEPLFRIYQELKARNNWNSTTFRQIYLPQFIREIRQSREAEQLLHYLWDADHQGKNILLCCFCPDETLCHRSIVAGILQGSGCHVVTDTGNEYSAYYSMYQSAG